MNNASTILPLDPVTLLARDRALAEKAMRRLPLPEQVRAVLTAPPERREAVILCAPDAAAVVQALPAQEFWLTVTAIGEGEALELIHLASAEQLQFCLDLDCWRKALWQPEPTLHWLRCLTACGEATVVEWWHTADPELLVLLMKRWVTIYLRAGDEEVTEVIPWPRPEPPFTLDNLYFFQCNDADVDRILRPMLEALGRADLPRLRHIFDATIGAIGAEQEEEAHAVRERRLAEEGFPPWAEAMGVYARLRPEEWARGRRTHPSVAPGEMTAPRFALMPLQEQVAFLRSVLTQLADAAMQETVLLECARLANRIVIADGHPVTPETARGAARKGIGYLNIGLELVSRGDIAAGVAALRDYWIVTLFQIGFSAVMQVAEAARAAWPRIAPTPDAVPDDPAAAVPYERVRAATWKWPKFYVGPAAPDGMLHRDFRERADLQAVEAAMNSCLSPSA